MSRSEYAVHQFRIVSLSRRLRKGAGVPGQQAERVGALGAPSREAATEAPFFQADRNHIMIIGATPIEPRPRLL